MPASLLYGHWTPYWSKILVEHERGPARGLAWIY